ncbi:MAG: T9SS type A sorting domain-containing protein, partial [Cyclobacteriaceae bacterium]
NDIHVLMDYVNNVNYNWGKANSAYGGDLVEGQSHHCNWVNNYYKPGPARSGSSTSYFVQASFNPNQTISKIPKWYLDGNHMEGTANTDRNTDNYVGLDADAYTEKGIDKSELISSVAFEVPYELNVESAEDAFTSVVEMAGAWPRDTCDTRIAREVRTGIAAGTGTIGNGMIDDPEVVGGFQVYDTYNIAADWDHDGMADYWEAVNELDSTNAEDRNNLTSDGYTVLEVYINYLAGEEHPDYTFPKPQYIDAQPEEPTEPELSKKNIETGFNVYVSEFDQLIIESIEPIANVVIYDLNGRIVQQSTSKELDISKLRNGLYISRVEMKNGECYPVKFMK